MLFKSFIAEIINQLQFKTQKEEEDNSGSHSEIIRSCFKVECVSIVLRKPKIDEILINLLVEQISVVSGLNKYFQNQEIIRPPKYFLISLNRAGIYNKIYKRVFLDKLFQCNNK